VVDTIITYLNELMMMLGIAHLIIPSIPMGLGIAADVFAVTLITAIVFPDQFRRTWFIWLLAVGGGHAVLPMVGQISVIYIGPILQEWIGLDAFWVESIKTIATIAGCWALWHFLSNVYEGIKDKAVEVYVGLTVGGWWGCTADAAYSGPPKSVNALEYDWNLYEVIMSNCIGAIVVMLVCLTATVLGLWLAQYVRKAIYIVIALLVELTILGYFLVFFGIARTRELAGFAGYAYTGPQLEYVAMAIAGVVVLYLFIKDWSDIYEAQAVRLSGKFLVDADGNAAGPAAA
jgi:hypothetical protein